MKEVPGYRDSTIMHSLGGKLDASYTISFARIRVGDIRATGIFGESEYGISARARAGGIMKQLNLVDGEASFSTHGIIKDGYPVPTTFRQWWFVP